MRYISFVIIATAMAAGTLQASRPILSNQDLKKIAVVSKNDSIRSGWCGRGMYSLLKKFGLGEGIKSGNGHDWEKILASAGWRPLRVSSPYRAPLGSVLVYMSDRRVGKPARNRAGGRYGHVEMVALAQNGGRLYVSDSPRVKPGGSVPDNFTGRAWVPPGTQLRANADFEARQVRGVMADRRSMAERFFRRSSDSAKLEFVDSKE